ncbi:hypothetical protein [Ruegeria arenilitoris]|uniref:hypothetical protein n=1 Tax=Ruegeria arenilitoris TaxID=1173585 RepID=UPI0015801E4C|nr:hypothetical protein [Ruegeria arenilitoris]
MIERDTKIVCDLVKSKLRTGTRTVVAIAGPPASGKSTLAQAVVRALNCERNESAPFAALLEMDGYHLDNRLLESRGLLARKGSPETFDAAGFAETVRRLEAADRETFHPKFDRQMDLSIANAVAISPDTPIVVVEGNYLLLKAEPWRFMKDRFSASVFVGPTMEVLQERLVQRWINHGLDAETALKKTLKNDLPNAELVLSASEEADILLKQDYDEYVQ